jgi:hypothetical protein
MGREQPMRNDSSSCGAPVSGAPACPVCGAPLAPTRDAWRCTRCFYTLCAGCEPGAVGGRDED